MAIYMALRAMWRLFGRRLAIWAVRRWVRRMEDELLRRHTEASGYDRGVPRREVFLNREVRLRYPEKPAANEPKKPANRAEIVEDIEFEDLGS